MGVVGSSNMGGAEYENGINVPIPKGRLQHGKPFGFAVLCLLQQKKEAFISQRN